LFIKLSQWLQISNDSPINGKQVYKKTEKAWKEKKTSGKTSRASLGYESSMPFYFNIKNERV
jgi:hypothetical protein